MKYLIIAILIFLTACENGVREKKQTRAQKRNIITTKVKFIEKDHDFGVIGLKDSISYKYGIVNLGPENYIITNIKASCGCTSPKWDLKPIPPGDTTYVEVGFKPTTLGIQEKSIVINSNVDSVFSVLHLRGNVTN